MNKIKWVIIGVGIIIVILIVLLMTTGDNVNGNKTTSNNKNEVQNITDEGTKPSTLKEEEMLEVGYTDYFAVSNCISEYLDRTNIKDANNYSVDEKIVFTPIKIAKATSGQVASYKVYGVTSNIDMEYKEDVYFIVNLDTRNKTYSVEQTDENMQVSKIEEISKNNDNTFTYQELSDEYKYKQIFNNMKKLMLVKPEIAYNYLDNEYKEKRFANYEEFFNHINNNRNIFIGINPEKYKKVDDNIFIIQDQYGNRYQFKMSETMKYEAKIDNYIIMNDDDIERYYEKLDKEEQVEYSIQRWFKMLEYKDYRCAFEFLDEEFRNDKIGNLNNFINLIQNIYSENKKYNISKTKKDGNVYIVEVIISNPDDEFSDKYMNIIIRLDDNAEFTMSFSIE